MRYAVIISQFQPSTIDNSQNWAMIFVMVEKGQALRDRTYPGNP